jgi:ketosteroid isomerase-like protein
MATISTSVRGISPAGRIAAATYLRGLAAVERGDFDQVLAQFRPDCELVFVSPTALGARLSGQEDVRRWFERFRRLLPDPSFDVQRLVIRGPVWDQRIAAHVTIRSRVAGEPYENQFAQFLTLRWGKVLEDLILEDTATWEAASRRLAAAGNSEAGGPPLTTKASRGSAASPGKVRAGSPAHKNSTPAPRTG